MRQKILSRTHIANGWNRENARGEKRRAGKLISGPPVSLRECEKEANFKSWPFQDLREIKWETWVFSSHGGQVLLVQLGFGVAQLQLAIRGF